MARRDGVMRALAILVAALSACGPPRSPGKAAEKSPSPGPGQPVPSTLPAQETAALSDLESAWLARLRPGDVLLWSGDQLGCEQGLGGTWSSAGLFVGDEESWAEHFDVDLHVNAWVERELGRAGAFADLVRARAPQASQRLGAENRLQAIVRGSGVALESCAFGGAAGAAALRPATPAVSRAGSVLAALERLGVPCDENGDLGDESRLTPIELVWIATRSNVGLPGLVWSLRSLDGQTLQLAPMDLAMLYAQERQQEVGAQLGFVAGHLRLFPASTDWTELDEQSFAVTATR